MPTTWKRRKIKGKTEARETVSRAQTVAVSYTHLDVYKRQILEAGESVAREPVYSQTAASHDGADYGGTYAEVNLTAQHLFFYKDGQKILESDFVSGNVSKGHTTCLLYTSIINTPNNPTGVVYSAGTLARMADILRERQTQLGTDIVLISDEPYRELALSLIHI